MSLITPDWRPTPAALRRFGATVLIGFALFGLVLQMRASPAAARWCYVIAVGVGALGLTGSRAALPPYLAWTGLAFVVGSITSRALIALIWYAVVAPLGLAMRLCGRDRLGLRRSDATSHWRDLPPPANDRCERQF